MFNLYYSTYIILYNFYNFLNKLQNIFYFSQKYETNKPEVLESLPTWVVTSRCIDVRAVWPSRDILDIELGPSRTITREPLFIYNPIDWSFLFLTCVALCNIINNNEGPFRLRLCRQLLFDLFYLYVCVYVCMYVVGGKIVNCLFLGNDLL